MFYARVKFSGLFSSVIIICQVRITTFFFRDIYVAPLFAQKPSVVYLGLFVRKVVYVQVISTQMDVLQQWLQYEILSH